MEIVRDYREDDAGPICRLFYETVRSVNLRDYSPEQVRGRRRPLTPQPGTGACPAGTRWSPKGTTGWPAFWSSRTTGTWTCSTAAGTGSGAASGRGSTRRRRRARALGLDGISTGASITARPFFERPGFRVVRRNVVVSDDVELVNFSMEKTLRPPGAGRTVR